MVIVPATSGQMGVLPGHVPSIVELKPGVLFVHEGSDVKQYFVSSGFAFIHANSVADIVANEAVPLDRFDPEEVRKGVQEYTQRVSNAKDDLERVQAQIGLEVHRALQVAIVSSQCTIIRVWDTSSPFPWDCWHIDIIDYLVFFNKGIDLSGRPQI